MYGKFENIGKSLIYHGKHNDRVYIMNITKEDFDKVIKRAENLAVENNYGKIFAKVPKESAKLLEKFDYEIEAKINNFYNGKEDSYFLGKFLKTSRKSIENKNLLKDVLDLAKKKHSIEEIELDYGYTIESLNESNCDQMANLYMSVFESYPFPIFNTEYLKETMKENIKYIGIFYKKKLVGIASAETYNNYKVAEMTDFAISKEFRGKNLALHLLIKLEELMINEGYKVLYTIARAESYGMNITFSKLGYDYCGMLKNNTNISGKIESMNVWSKKID